MNIILAAPNTASTSLVNVINKHTNHFSTQIFHYPNTTSLIRKRGIYYYLKRFKFNILLKMVSSYYFLNIVDRYLKINNLNIFNPTKDFKNMSALHSDICDFDYRLLWEFNKFIFNQKNLILKQHFPPTDNNLEFFKNFKKIILVRDTYDILKRYKNKIKYKYQFIDEEKLKTEIDIWKNKWMSENETLIIHYEELINNPYKQLKLIQEYTGIKFNISEKFVLPHLNKTISVIPHSQTNSHK